MRHLRNATLTALILLALGGGLIWSTTRNTPATEASTGVEAASGQRSRMDQPVSTTTPVQASIPAGTTQATTKATSGTIKTTGQQPNNTTTPTGTENPKNTTASTVQRPGKQRPVETTSVSTPKGDPNLIVDNGYINLDGVRVSSIAGYGKYGMDIVEKCGRISNMVVKIWFKYADGRIRDERWTFNGKQVNVFRTDEDGRPAWRPVLVEASGLDPYGEGWTEEHGFPSTEWIWCANRPPINQ